VNDRPCAVITGADGGIGAATASVLAADGHDLGLTWFHDSAAVDRAAQAARSGGSEVHVHRLDLREARQSASTVEALADALGGLDVLVANAAVNELGSSLETDIDAFRAVIDANVTGTTAVLLAAGRRMVADGNGGRIIVVTSIHERLPLARALAYTASKHALGGVVKVLALELASHGIRVNAVAPGLVATRMGGAEGADAFSLDHSRAALRRPGAAQEVAAVIRFLSSTESSYLTGSSYAVDGGMALTAGVTFRPPQRRATRWPRGVFSRQNR
jgi:NAD(P)-dependent dehydrogenase (short-subunit alcohol dehydrogenase family)